MELAPTCSAGAGSTRAATRAPWRKRNVRVPRRRRPRGTGARSTSRLRTRPPAAPCSPSPGCAAPLGRSHADAGDGGGAGAGAAAAPARQPCGRRASIDAFTVARDGTPLPRAALGAKVEPVWAIEIFFGPFLNFLPCSMASRACMQNFKPWKWKLQEVYGCNWITQNWAA